MEVRGGSIGVPEAMSARVNQRASSSSELPEAREPGAALAMKPSISDEGNGQGCEEW
jgi:hypothetical protein